MYNNNAYQIQSMFNGWTRIDMLLALYDRAIVSTRQAQEAQQANNDAMFAEKFIDAQRTILAIHSGLKPDEYELSHNIARLLHFIATRLSEHNFDEAVHFLEKLRNSFEQIREEATKLEIAGKLPSFELNGHVNQTA
jgi:flagellar protein FliS